MSQDDDDSLWAMPIDAGEMVLLLARELEWVEAYVADFPDCKLGAAYLDLVRHELVAAQSSL